jgi:RNA polymerase sigma-70 factor, ECF subfamily
MDDKTRDVARLWTLAQPAVSAFIASLVRDFRARDDVLQDVAVAVLDSFASYDPSRPFAAWAIGIARNQVLLYLRSKGRDRLVFDPDALARIESAFAEVRPHEVRMLDYLDECVQLLEGRARQLCELRYRGDLKPAAIGRRVGMSANGVAKTLQRAREALRGCVERKAALNGS